ncbi:MAG: hypothetical protein PVSMB1_05200 [Gemmatimonadaceae bacterium]
MIGWDVAARLRRLGEEITLDPLYQESDRRRLVRGMLLSVNWIFGKGKKEKDRGTIDTGDSGG